MLQNGRRDRVRHQETSMAKQKQLTYNAVRRFRRRIYGYYRKNGRQFPWRETREPYQILVSEIMLQQTQTERVAKKFGQFVKRFPDFDSLAKSPLRDVLDIWQGLGYNRRAIALREAAELVLTNFDGKLPACVDSLVKLPGIGKATASAICVFAFDQPAVFIETNIRRVFLHFFFPHENGVRDADILPLVEKTLDRKNPRDWYYALMDYGVMLKKENPNPNRRSAHYQKQPPFKGSDRQIRGTILKLLVEKRRISERQVMSSIDTDAERIRRILCSLCEEGFIKKKGAGYTIF